MEEEDLPPLPRYEYLPALPTPPKWLADATKEAIFLAR
jgi:hypothetical protein